MPASGQSHSDDSTIISIAIDSLTGKKDTVIYVDTSLGWWKEDKELIKKKELEDIRSSSENLFRYDSKSRKLKLSKDEKLLLLRQMETAEKIEWSENLFANSIRIGNKNALSYFRRQDSLYKVTIEAAIAKKDIETLRKLSRRPYKWIFYFSKPIYFRSDNLSIVHIMAICGRDCGHVSVFVFKRMENNWEYWIELSAGSF